MAKITLDQRKFTLLKDNVKSLLALATIKSADARRMSANAAREVARSFSEKAAAQRTGRDIQLDIFYTDSDKTKASWIITQLAGIRKRGRSRPYAHNYREWHARSARTLLRWRGKKGAKQIAGGRTVMTGQLIGMSLAKMFERGTAKLKPRPFVRAAINAGRYRAYRLLEAELRVLLFSQLRRAA